MGLRPIGHSMTWQQALRDRLLRRYSEQDDGHTATRTSEEVLEFDRPHVYWYLLYVDPDYREAIILSSVSGDSPNEAPRLSPFDTGGVAAGHIPLPEPLTSPADFVRRYTYSWAAGLTEFGGWLERAYRRPSDYWDATRAVRPLEGMTSIDLMTCTSSKAWAWESRLPLELADRSSTIHHETIMMRPELYNVFLNWLPENPGSSSDDEIIQLGAWLKQHATTTDTELAECGRWFDRSVSSEAS